MAPVAAAAAQTEKANEQGENDVKGERGKPWRNESEGNQDEIRSVGSIGDKIILDLIGSYQKILYEIILDFIM